MDSNFQEIANCPLCKGAPSGVPFFKRDFASPEVTSYLQNYYDGRVDLRVLTGGVLRIENCGKCDFFWQRFVLDTNASRLLYEEWISPEQSLDKQLALPLSKHMQVLHLVERLLTRVNAQVIRPRVLDFGGGWGSCTVAATALGCEPFLLDASASRTERAIRTGVRTFQNLAEIPDGFLNLVILNQVMEHIANPLELLAGLASKLVVGGGIYISVPRARRGARVLAKGPFQPLEHVNGFTPVSLEKLVRSSGLLPVADYTRYTELSVRGIARGLMRNLSLLLVSRRFSRSTAILATRHD